MSRAPIRPTRDSEARVKSYRPPSVLDMPPAPPGVEYRWIRVLNRGQDDLKSMSSRQRDGWEPVKVEDHPDYAGNIPAVSEGRFSGVFGVGDLVLMRNDIANNAARRRYYQAKTDNAQAAIDNDVLSVQHSSMPLSIDRKSSVSTGARSLDFDK